MICALPILLLLVAPSMSEALDSWESSESWKDLRSWRPSNSWEDGFNRGNQKSVPDPEGWGDGIGLEHRGWDSHSDQTLPLDDHHWNRKKRSLDKIESGATVLESMDQYRQRLGSESMETAEVNAIFLPAKFLLRKKASYKMCRRMLDWYNSDMRRSSSSSSLSGTLGSPPVYTRKCNDFCCYPVPL